MFCSVQGAGEEEGRVGEWQGGQIFEINRGAMEGLEKGTEVGCEGGRSADMEETRRMATQFLWRRPRFWAFAQRSFGSE